MRLILIRMISLLIFVGNREENIKISVLKIMFILRTISLLLKYGLIFSHLKLII